MKGLSKMSCDHPDVVFTAKSLKCSTHKRCNGQCAPYNVNCAKRVIAANKAWTSMWQFSGFHSYFFSFFPPILSTLFFSDFGEVSSLQAVQGYDCNDCSRGCLMWGQSASPGVLDPDHDGVDAKGRLWFCITRYYIFWTIKQDQENNISITINTSLLNFGFVNASLFFGLRSNIVR